MEYDVLIIGAGPAGIACAHRSAASGLRTAIVESDAWGGTGYRWGCFPSKVLLAKIRSKQSKRPISPNMLVKSLGETVEQRIHSDLERSGITAFQGNGRFSSSLTYCIGKKTLKANSVVIATGTSPYCSPALQSENTVTHREALQLDRIPSSLVIVGGDVEGVEMAAIFSSLGTKVTVIEQMQTILPGYDRDLVRPVLERLNRQQACFITGCQVVSASTRDGRAVVLPEQGNVLSADLVLITGIRKPNFPDGLDETGIVCEPDRIVVDDRLQTSQKNIYAIGDINGILGMSHAAIQQGHLLGRLLAGEIEGPLNTNYAGLPRAVFTQPEIAGAGVQEMDLQRQGTTYKSHTYPLDRTWRGVAEDLGTGFIKCLVGKKGRILGLWASGEQASELAGLWGLLIEKNITQQEIERSLAIHPTLSEGILAALREG